MHFQAQALAVVAFATLFFVWLVENQAAFCC
jgi:hypothetical protein